MGQDCHLVLTIDKPVLASLVLIFPKESVVECRKPGEREEKRMHSVNILQSPLLCYLRTRPPTIKPKENG